LAVSLAAGACNGSSRKQAAWKRKQNWPRGKGSNKQRLE
jgi:hypothetical protein